MERFLKINSRWSLLTSSIANRITYFFQVTRQIYSLQCLDKFLLWKFSQLSRTIYVKENALWRHWRINVTCHSSCIHVVFLCSYCKRKKIEIFTGTTPLLATRFIGQLFAKTNAKCMSWTSPSLPDSLYGRVGARWRHNQISPYC